MSLMCMSTKTYARFFDVDPLHPYADAIDYLLRTGIVTGYENRSFRPENAINRAEFTKILVSLLYPAHVTQDCLDSWPEFSFPDIAMDAWYAPYICAAWTNGIVSGYPDGTFKPEEGVQFVEAAKMLSLAFELTGIELPNLGAASVEWYEPYVEFLAAKNAIPYSITSVSKPVNRGEMAEMMYRLKDSPLQLSAVTQKSKSAADVLYPVDWKNYENYDLQLAFSYPSVWAAPHVLSRGTYDGRSPYFTSEWTVFFGPSTSGCLGSQDCMKRDMWIDGYRTEDSKLILDAILNDEYFIQLEDETITNSLPSLVLLEEVGTCIDKRAFYFGKKWIYALNIRCAGQDDKLNNFFDQMMQSVRELAEKPKEYRKL